jgi:hypothetical protein
MRDILIFLSGSVFTLALLGGSLFFAFKITDYREDLSIKREEKRKKASIKAQEGRGGVIKPKTYAEKQFEKDETSQAFLEIIGD